MFVRGAALAGALAVTFVLSGLAQAQDVSTARSDVNMRSGPGTSHARIVVIPAGAQVRVHECSGWCRVTYEGRSGWVAAAYLGRGASTRPREGYAALSDWNRWEDESDWTYFRYPYGYWFTSPGGYWWSSPGVLFRF